MVQSDLHWELFCLDQISVHWSGPGSEATFTPVTLVWTKLNVLKIRTKQGRCDSPLKVQVANCILNNKYTVITKNVPIKKRSSNILIIIRKEEMIQNYNVWKAGSTNYFLLSCFWIYDNMISYSRKEISIVHHYYDQYIRHPGCTTKKKIPHTLQHGVSQLQTGSASDSFIWALPCGTAEYWGNPLKADTVGSFVCCNKDQHYGPNVFHLSFFCRPQLTVGWDSS